MGLIQYILWNGSPEIFSFGSFALRWYGLLFASGFLITQQILFYIHRQEGKPEKDVETLTIYMVVATIIGARLGHVIFYQPELFWTDPLSIVLPFEFKPEFRFTGLKGLASHGGAFGILFALWLYSRKKKPNQNYLQVLDRIVILVAFTGALIRLGNFFNSEIIGKPTEVPWGVVFANPVQELMQGTPGPTNPVQKVVIERDTTSQKLAYGRKPIKVFVFFRNGLREDEVKMALNRDVKYALSYAGSFVDDNVDEAIRSQLVFDEKANQFVARVRTHGIVRHPAQLYEAISCMLLFLFLYAIWKKYKINLPEGRIFGYFMIILWGLRFAYEFLKENQETFENDLPINMGQILSIPLVLVGVYILVRSYRQPAPRN